MTLVQITIANKQEWTIIELQGHVETRDEQQQLNAMTLGQLTFNSEVFLGDIFHRFSLLFHL